MFTLYIVVWIDKRIMIQKRYVPPSHGNSALK